MALDVCLVCSETAVWYWYYPLYPKKYCDVCLKEKLPATAEVATKYAKPINGENVKIKSLREHREYKKTLDSGLD